jgi:hypothetical protein
MSASVGRPYEPATGSAISKTDASRSTMPTSPPPQKLQHQRNRTPPNGVGCAEERRSGSTAVAVRHRRVRQSCTLPHRNQRRGACGSHECLLPLWLDHQARDVALLVWVEVIKHGGSAPQTTRARDSNSASCRCCAIAIAGERSPARRRDGAALMRCSAGIGLPACRRA